MSAWVALKRLLIYGIEEFPSARYSSRRRSRRHAATRDA
jgi:hypothetical protein